MTALDTIPAYYEIASPETIPLAFDVSNYLGQTDSVQTSPAPSFTITDVNSGQDKSSTMLEGSPAVNGNLITQVVKAAISGEQYWLLGTFTVSANKVLSFRVRLVADY